MSATESGALEQFDQVEGTCDERFLPVRTAFAHNLDTGMDIGASVALFIDGEPVVDLWGGYFDATYTRPWERDTIVQTFSTTKTMTALCALLLADRGELDLDAPVVRYWPEFAAEGKSEIEVRQLLGYTGGLAGWTEAVSLNDIYDHGKSAALLAGQAPWWKPGTAGGYHTLTIGHLVGELVLRVTGKTLGRFFADEIAGPLGAEYHIGTGPEHDSRVSLLIQGSPDEPKGDRFFERSMLNPRVTPQVTWSLPWRRAEIGAANGHGNARGIAAAQSVLACGEAFGVRLMSQAGRERVLETQSDGIDLVMGVPIRWGMGYCVGAPGGGLDFGPRVAYWGGNGGSMAYVDFDHRMSFGYAPNRWIRGAHELDRCRLLLQALYDALEAIGRSAA
jgi:CubicO group peptidase (beta-lactamase class C family)